MTGNLAAQRERMSSMDILGGSDTRGPIRLGFTRAEFDYLCSALEAGDAPSSVVDDDVCGAILRFRATFADGADLR